jgi:hypothetical protein
LQYAEDIESGSSDVETKYKKMYEDDINPFAAFSRKVDIFDISSATHVISGIAHSSTMFFLPYPGKGSKIQGTWYKR